MTEHSSTSLPDLTAIDQTWTLFLDRDGVINEETVGEYVLNWQQFIFSKDALKAFEIFTHKFGRIFIVTNQRGVSKKLMTEEDLHLIHKEMQIEISAAGGKIDKIYYCIDLDDACFYRKPNPGMAVQAKEDFPEIDFRRSIMVGNKPSDMKFGRASGMFTVFVASTHPDQTFPHPDIDMMVPSLYAFAQALQS